jgi:hypothetical protein
LKAKVPLAKFSLSKASDFSREFDSKGKDCKVPEFLSLKKVDGSEE